ncbi:hypothetical protein RRG08_049639 [Elysia crispata]|uniref:Uncharacterized protein n=1 Tax=Elysia crispata TaxID=231223 RepID=A0AAE1BBV6_9GAST|nr:hypothetical protein RRG08_049639 [Elysia crispata]
MEVRTDVAGTLVEPVCRPMHEGWGGEISCEIQVSGCADTSWIIMTWEAENAKQSVTSCTSTFGGGGYSSHVSSRVNFNQSLYSLTFSRIQD